MVRFPNDFTQKSIPISADRMLLYDSVSETLKWAYWGDLKIEWQGAWDSGTTYSANDVVTHNGSAYICILASTNNEPPNATYWTLISEGVDWSGLAAWNSGTTYKVNDLATLNGSLYVCTTEHSNQEPPNGSYWLKATEGLDWANLAAWDSGTTYKVDDVVTSGGGTYVCILEHSNQVPPNGTYWIAIAEKGDTGLQGDSLSWQGAWDSGTTYSALELVSHSGSVYLCILASTNNEPPNATYWQLITIVENANDDLSPESLDIASGYSRTIFVRLGRTFTIPQGATIVGDLTIQHGM